MKENQVKKIRCSRCRWLLPATTTYFYISKKGTRGFTSQCKQCCREGAVRRKKYGPYPKGNIVPKQQRCNRCHDILPFTKEYFVSCSTSRYGICLTCKQCQKERNIRNLLYIPNKKQYVYQKQKEWANNNPEKRAATYVRYRENGGREKHRQYKIKRRKDTTYRLLDSLRTRLRSALRAQGVRKTTATMRLCGCSLRELRQYIQQQFQEGMSWNNYGYWGWHIDHIKPCSAFDLTDLEQQKQCFHYTNLQPLWCTDNWRKKDNYTATD